MRALTPTALAAALVLAATPAAASILVDGSFEAQPIAPGGFNPYAGGSTLGGWTVGGSVVSHVSDTYTEPGPIMFDAQQGLASVDLTGPGNNGFASVSQVVALTPGASYNLSFWVGAMTSSGFYGGFYTLPSTVGLSLTGYAAQLFTNTDTTPEHAVWTRFDVAFIATSASTTVQFYNPTGNDNFVGLDNVSLTAVSAAIPEPASWALLIAGFGLTGAALRRRQGGGLARAT